MRALLLALTFLLIANIGSVFITDVAPMDPDMFGEKPFHAHTVFEINGEATDPSRWSATWGPNRSGKPRGNSQTEVELMIGHGIRDTDLVYVEILADSQDDADAIMSLVEEDFSQAYRPAAKSQQSNGRQHIEEDIHNNRFFWRQRFELLLIANSVVIFLLLIQGIFSIR